MAFQSLESDHPLCYFHLNLQLVKKGNGNMTVWMGEEQFMKSNRRKLADVLQT
jgi:hypothetical protein